MTIAEALRKRLAIYKPKRCPRWREALKQLNETTEPLELFLQLPGFAYNPIPTKLRRRWFYRQLQLARRMCNGTD